MIDCARLEVSIEEGLNEGATCLRIGKFSSQAESKVDVRNECAIENSWQTV